jgi:hypothetical protein
MIAISAGVIIDWGGWLRGLLLLHRIVIEELAYDTRVSMIY